MSARRATKFDEFKQGGAESDIYSDFDSAFLPHPFSGQIARRTDVDSVKMALRNLILTNKYERLRNPEFGGNIRRYLFETFTETTGPEIEEEIRSLIRNYEPRVQIVELIVTPLEDQNAMSVRLVFKTNMIQDNQNLDITLYRVR